MSLRTSGLVLGAALAFVATALLAAEKDNIGKLPFKPDAGRGHETAAKLCSSCHVIDKKQAGAVPPGVPSFFFMANKPDQSDEKLANRMIHPFPPMIDLHLTTHEIKDIAMYILSLKSRE